MALSRSVDCAFEMAVSYHFNIGDFVLQLLQEKLPHIFQFLGISHQIYIENTSYSVFAP